jgi:hypothetical protein
VGLGEETRVGLGEEITVGLGEEIGVASANRAACVANISA